MMITCPMLVKHKHLLSVMGIWDWQCLAATQKSIILALMALFLPPTQWLSYQYTGILQSHHISVMICFLRCVVAARWVWAGDLLIISCSGLFLWILVDLKAKPWTQTLKIHFDKHISLGYIKTESNKPSTSGVRAQLFWTSSSGSHNKQPPQLSAFWCLSSHCWHRKLDTLRLVGGAQLVTLPFFCRIGVSEQITWT